MLKIEDRAQIAEISKKIRETIMEVEIPSDVVGSGGSLSLSVLEMNMPMQCGPAPRQKIYHSLLCRPTRYVFKHYRKEAILQHVSGRRASLFTDRAVTYRIQNGFDHRQVSSCVVVQRMVFPQASGILFTADPITGNRKVLSIDASFGLGEALVSGLVYADNYKVKEGEIVDKKIATKKLAIYALKDGGTEKKEIIPRSK